MDAARLQPYTGGMRCLIYRRLVAFALAYALALDPVVPMLSAAAWIGDLGQPGMGEICASKRSGARSTADVPLEHRPICPLCTGCLMPGCDAGALPAIDAGAAAILALGPAPLFVPFRGAAVLPRASMTHSARAPPRA
jgi:hypothetical protein